MNKITTVTDEQIAFAASYREKWQSVAVSTEPINQKDCTEIIKHLYQRLHAKEPEILFFKSPSEALKSKGEFIKNSRDLYQRFCQIEHFIENEIHKNLNFSPSVWDSLNELRNIEDIGQSIGTNYSIMNQLKTNFKKFSQSVCYSWIRPSENISNSTCQNDYLISTLNLIERDKIKSLWELMKKLDEQMGWYNLLPNVCIVSDRPCILKFDNQNKIHMDGAPAIEFSDGFSIFAFHGTILPKKYGQIPSNQWNPLWLLEKTSDEMRRTLINGMGFELIRNSFHLKEVDELENYRLWQVKDEILGKPIVLLTHNTNQGLITHSVAPRLRKVEKALEWLHLRYCQEDIVSGN
jgi:hypothetical protein